MKEYKCINEHEIRLHNDIHRVCVGDKVEVDLNERNGDILVGYHGNGFIEWKRVHASVLKDFKEVV